MADALFQAGVRDALCAVCGGRRGVKGHHIISQQALRDFCRSKKLPEQVLTRLLSDARNRLAVCKGCEDDHERANNRIPRHALPQAVFQFAKELGDWAAVRLEREYPA